MNEQAEGVVAEEKALRLAEYGLAGDHASARRSRRGFRFLVAAVVFFTFTLWFSENHMRFDRTESQYRMALTLPPDSARAILRNVVKRDAERNGTPAARYVEALASVEESDLILPRYEEACRLNPNNPFLIINYGCRLFLNGQYREARERFREAGVQPPKNALPRYLEAAALAAGAPEGDLTEAIALIARTNSTGDPVIFPQPLWHSSLPRRGAWYAQQRREIIDLCCAPIYRLRSQIVAQARRQIQAGQTGDWDSWLEKIQVMGERFVGTAVADPANLGVPQAIAGVQMQLDAIALRQRIAEMGRGAPDAALIERGIKLDHALNDLKSFEALRARKTAEHRAIIALPLRLLAQSLGILILVYALVTLLARLTDAGKRFWAVPHPSWAPYPLIGIQAVFLALLMIISLMQHVENAAPSFNDHIAHLWYAVLLLSVGFVFIYPVLALPGTGRICAALDSENPETVRSVVRRRRVMACISLMRRTCGLLAGGLMCVACCWMIGYRLAAAAYPTQMELLVTGLENDEWQIVQRVLEMLS